MATAAELQDALAAAAAACAQRAKAEAEFEGGYASVAETWASAAAQLTYAIKGSTGALPARPGKG